MSGWMTCDFTFFLTGFQSYQKYWVRDNERLYAMEVCLRLQRCPLQARLDPEAARSAGQCLTKGDGILKHTG